MPIEAKLIKWDETPQIDPKGIKWDEPPQNNRAWSDVPLEAVKNIPRSAGNMLGGIYQSIRHPIDTAGVLLDAAAGGLKNVTPKALADIIDQADPNPQSAEKAVQVADAVGNLYKKRYGSIEGLKETIATDPVGFAGDISTVFSAGAAVAPKASKAAQVLRTGAQYTNPLNAITPVISYVGDKTAPIAESGAKRLMQSALKPTMEQLRKGQADTAVTTLLDEGINATKGGVEKLKDRISSVNDEISNLVKNSKGTVDKDNVLSAISNVKSKFTSQVSPGDDLSAIDKVARDFSNHPYFKNNEAHAEVLRQAVETAKRQKEMALQAAGKLETFGAQQKSLAEGRRIPLSVNQPEFQPYYNTGSMGRVANSPSSQPVDWMPRIPARYTNNIERVKEGAEGAADARNIYLAKRAEEAAAAKSLEDFQKTANGLSVKDAQALKQGTYKVLNKKYGQIGSAEIEAQKGLARGLKEGIAEAVPEVKALNARESKLLDTLSVTERRVLMDANKNPMGLSLLANNPASWAAFMADKSAAFKSVAARMLHQSAQPNKLTTLLRKSTPEQTRLILLLNQAGQQPQE